MVAGFGAIGATAAIGSLDAFLGGLTRIGTAFEDVGKAATKMNAPIAVATEGFKGFNTAMTGVGNTLGLVGTAFGTVTAPIRGALTLLEESGSRAVDALEGIGAAAAGLGAGGAVGIVAFGSALTGAFGASLATAARFQREVVDLGAITQATAPQIGAVTDAVRKMATQFGLAIPEIQGASLELARAGVPIQSISAGGLELALSLEQLAKGELTAAKGAEALGSIFQVFRRDFDAAGNDSTQALTRIANAVTGIANETRATIPEVISAFNKMGSAFATTGQSVEQAAAAVGLLLGAGVRGEEAGTALSNFFLRLQAPSRESRAIMERFGISMADAEGRTRPYSAVLADLIDKFGPMERKIRGITDEEANWALAEIFQTRTLRATNIALLQGTKAYEDFKRAIAETDVIAQAAQQNEALLRQLGILRNNVDLAAIAFGSNFVPGLAAVTKELNTVLSVGERAQQMFGALGGGLRAAVSGQGGGVGGPAQGAITEQFGEGAGEAFAHIEVQVQRVLASIGETVGAAGRLKDTFLEIVFPSGPSDLVGRLTDTFIQVQVAIQGALGFLGAIGPVAASALGTAIQGVIAFLGQLKEVATAGLGAEDVRRIFESVGGAVKSVVDDIGGVALAVARFIRVVIEVRDPLLGMLTLASKVFGVVLQGIINLTTAVVFLSGQIGRLVQAAASIPVIGPRVIQQLAPNPGEPFVAEGFTGPVEDRGLVAIQRFGEAMATSQSQAEDFFGTIGQGTDTISELWESFRTGETTVQRQIRGLGELVGILESGDLRQVGSFFGKDFVPADAQDNLVEIRRLIEELGTATGAEEQADILARLTIEGEHARASVAAAMAALRPPERAAINISGEPEAGPGAGRDFAEEERERQRRAKALIEARNRLTEAGEDATKNLGASFRTLNTALEAVEQRLRDGLEGLAESVVDTFENLTRTARENRDKLIEAFDLSRSREAITRNARQTQEDERLAFDQNLENQRFMRQVGAEEAEVIEARKDRTLEQLEQRHFDNVSRIRQRGIDDGNQVFARGQEDTLRILQESNERAVQALTRTFDETNLGRGRTREDEKRRRDLGRDLGKATTSEARREIQERFEEETRSLAERRKEEDSERQIRKQQEDQLQAVRKTQELGVIQFRRAQEDTAQARRRGQEESDIKFRIGLEEAFQRSRDNIEDFARRRRTNLQIEELGVTRGEQELGRQFGRRQADNFRENITEPFAQQDFDRAIQENEVRLERALAKLEEDTVRRVNQLNRTASREVDAALETFLNGTQTVLDRFNDLRTDLIRSAPEIAGEFGSAFVGVQADISLAIGTARGVVDAAIERMGGLKESADNALGGFLAGLRELREGNGEETITVRAFISSPQGDRIIELLERVVNNTASGSGRRGGGDSPVIGEVNIVGVENATDGVQELERIFESVGGNQ